LNINFGTFLERLPVLVVATA